MGDSGIPTRFLAKIAINLFIFENGLKYIFLPKIRICIPMFSHFFRVFIKVINYFISEISSIMHVFLKNLLLTQAKFVRFRQNQEDKNRVRLSESVTDIGILLQISECVGIPESPILFHIYIIYTNIVYIIYTDRQSILI